MKNELNINYRKYLSIGILVEFIIIASIIIVMFTLVNKVDAADYTNSNMNYVYTSQSYSNNDSKYSIHYTLLDSEFSDLATTDLKLTKIDTQINMSNENDIQYLTIWKDSNSNIIYAINDKDLYINSDTNLDVSIKLLDRKIIDLEGHTNGIYGLYDRNTKIVYENWYRIY